MAEEKAPKSLKDLITDDDTEKCLETIRDIRDDAAAPRSLRLQAAEQLLDRKHGKARQYVEQQTVVTTYQDLLNNIATRENRWAAVTGAPPVALPQEPQPEPEAVIDVTPTLVVAPRLEDLL